MKDREPVSDEHLIRDIEEEKRFKSRPIQIMGVWLWGQDKAIVESELKMFPPRSAKLVRMIPWDGTEKFEDERVRKFTQNAIKYAETKYDHYYVMIALGKDCVWARAEDVLKLTEQAKCESITNSNGCRCVHEEGHEGLHSNGRELLW